jgi:hypothetical protein
MSIMDQKPWTVSAEDLKLRWMGSRHYFRCSVCTAPFKLGDTARFVYGNDGSSKFGNFLVCAGCDGPDVKMRHNAIWDDFSKRAKAFGWSR